MKRWFSDFFENKNDPSTFSKKYRFLRKNNSNDAPEVKTKSLQNESNIIYFASIQDMRGATYQKDANGDDLLDDAGNKIFKRDGDHKIIWKETNHDVFDTEWDLVVIDEAHEGNATTLAEQMHADIKRKFTLYLSGTTFYIRRDAEFEKKFNNGKNTYTFNYEDECKTKSNWLRDRGTDANPYADLPDICLCGVSIDKKNLDDGINETGYKNNYFDFNCVYYNLFRLVGESYNIIRF